MIKIYKTDIDTDTLSEIHEFEKGSWINVTKPKKDEIKLLSQHVNIPESDILSFLDEEEQARTEVEDNYRLIVLDIPSFERHATYNVRVTSPLVIIHVRDDYIITLSSKETDLLNDFVEGKIKKFHTEMKSRFTIQIMLQVANAYIKDLKSINEETNKSEKALKK